MDAKKVVVIGAKRKPVKLEPINCSKPMKKIVTGGKTKNKY